METETKRWESTSIINCVGWGGSGWSPGIQWTGITTRAKQYTKSTAVISMDVHNATGQSMFYYWEKGQNVTREDVYQRTLRRNEANVKVGYNLVVRWNHERPYPRRCRLPGKQNEMFPHAIETPTADLVFQGEHIPVSVSLADTFDRELERISAKDPKELIRQFWETLIRRGEILRKKVRQSYVPED